MDSVRFGRALGLGARQAAKTLVTAVDAATSPNPSMSAPAAHPHAQRAQPLTAPGRAGQQAARTTHDLRSTTQGIARGSRRFGEAVWGPVVKLSGVLWLELTGVFFGLFALFASIAVWKLRGNFHRTPTNADARTHFQLAVGMAVLFGYFCVSSFVRAHHRGRRR